MNDPTDIERLNSMADLAIDACWYYYSGNESIDLADWLRVKDAAAEIVRLREALGFYADPENYHAIAIFGDRPCGMIADDVGSVDHPDYDRWMNGRYARAVLAGEVDARPIDYYDRTTWTTEHLAASDD